MGQGLRRRHRLEMEAEILVANLGASARLVASSARERVYGAWYEARGARI